MNNTLNKNVCSICGKKAVIGLNKPHSMHRTKRLVLPNIQKNNGEYLCTKCLRTKNQKGSR